MTAASEARRVASAQPGERAHGIMALRPVAEPGWTYTRYADQPVSLRSRLFGAGGVGAVGLAFLAATFLTWHIYTAPKAQPVLNVFNVAPPAAPPAPVKEVPPGPEKQQKEKPEPDIRPKVTPPKVEVPSLNPLPLPSVRPQPDPGPPVKETTAPEVKPAPPAPQQTSGKPTWEGLVLGALNKAKRYPRDAFFARQQGVPYIRFVMNREGKVLSVVLERSSGFRTLDQEALSLPKRAQPLPRPPEEVKGDSIELVVPVEFFMR